MFRGVHAVNLDAKGRWCMPARFRDLLQEEFESPLVITIDYEQPCLLVYPLPEWEKIQAKIESLPSLNPASRRLQRLLIGHATDVDMDAQGRILLPGMLRDYAKLEKKLVLIGQGKKIELWSSQAWEDARDTWLLEAQQMQAEDLPEAMQGLSL